MALWTIKRIPKFPAEGDSVEAVTFDDTTDGDVVEAAAKLREDHPDHNIFVDHFKPVRPDENIPGTVTPNGSAQEKIADIAKANPNTRSTSAGIGDGVVGSTVTTTTGTKVVAADPAGPDAPVPDGGAKPPADGTVAAPAKVDDTGHTEPAPAAAV